MLFRNIIKSKMLPTHCYLYVPFILSSITQRPIYMFAIIALGQLIYAGIDYIPYPEIYFLIQVLVTLFSCFLGWLYSVWIIKQPNLLGKSTDIRTWFLVIVSLIIVIVMEIPYLLFWPWINIWVMAVVNIFAIGFIMIIFYVDTLRVIQMRKDEEEQSKKMGTVEKIEKPEEKLEEKKELLSDLNLTDIHFHHFHHGKFLKEFLERKFIGFVNTTDSFKTFMWLFVIVEIGTLVGFIQFWHELWGPWDWMGAEAWAQCISLGVMFGLVIATSLLFWCVKHVMNHKNQEHYTK